MDTLAPTPTSVPLTDETVEPDPSEHAHILRRGPNDPDGVTMVFEARINGTPLTALCGYVFVPQRDPQQFPVCAKCKEIYQMHNDFNGGGFDETPRS